MSKHTPGPWKLLEFEGDRYAVTNEAGTKRVYRQIAEVSFGYFEPAETEQHANARLIAAAPELLDALNGLLAECERNGCFQDVSFDHPMVKPSFDAARAAIAKATGAA